MLKRNQQDSKPDLNQFLKNNPFFVVDDVTYFVSGPVSGNLFLVKYVLDNGNGENEKFETFCSASSNGKGFDFNLCPISFPMSSVLAYGKNAAIIMRYDGQKSMGSFGLLSMKTLDFAPQIYMSFHSLMRNGSPFDSYNEKALFALCNGSDEFCEFLNTNGVPVSDEGKLMFFEIANKIINMQSSEALNSVYQSLHSDEETQSKEDIAKNKILEHLHDPISMNTENGNTVPSQKGE